MNKPMKDAVKQRRSNYTMKATSLVSDKEIDEIIETAVLHTPTAFNSQSSKVVLLNGDAHKKLWELTKMTLRDVVPANAFAATETKINGFMAGYATLLYFDDTEITDGLVQTYTLYKDNFAPWAQQSNGMLQFAIWTMLDDAGLAVNLQHYNPLIDEVVKENFDIPKTWKFIAQMPFGDKTGEAGTKEFEAIDKRFLKRK